VQIVQCIFFERCVQKLSVSGSCIFLVILNHFRPCCLPIVYPCRLHLSSMPASSSIFVASLRQLFFFPFVPFGGIFAAALYISCRRVRVGLYSVRRSRSVFCQRSGLTV